MPIMFPVFRTSNFKATDLLDRVSLDRVDKGSGTKMVDPVQILVGCNQIL